MIVAATAETGKSMAVEVKLLIQHLAIVLLVDHAIAIDVNNVLIKKNAVTIKTAGSKISAILLLS